MENKAAAQELIKKYRSITLKDIEEINFKYQAFHNATRLTGFGYIFTCSLCIEIKAKCNACIYGRYHGCKSSIYKKSYYNIMDARTKVQLLQAFRNRADVIEKLITKK